jgi:multiple sugar transport system permease protein
MAQAQTMTTAVTGQRRLSRAQRRILTFYLFISPWLIGLLALGVLPLVVALITSFTNYDGLNLDTVKFVGPRNYVRAFSDPDVGYSLRQTLFWTVLNVPLWLISSFALAVLLTRLRYGQGLFRTLFYIPSVIPLVASVWIWRIFLDANYGLLNGMVSVVRPGTAVQWLADYGVPSLTGISLWAGVGSGMVIFLAGLQGIPTELEEAARIDGAGFWGVLRYVTLPLMTPVIFFQLVLALISAGQQFAMPMLVGYGGSGTSNRSLYLYMVHTYQQIFGFQRFGYGMALLWIFFGVVLILTLILFGTSRHWVYYEQETEGGRL